MPENGYRNVLILAHSQEEAVAVRAELMKITGYPGELQAYAYADSVAMVGLVDLGLHDVIASTPRRKEHPLGAVIDDALMAILGGMAVDNLPAWIICAGLGYDLPEKLEPSAIEAWLAS